MTDPDPTPTGARRFMLVMTALAAAWTLFEIVWWISGSPAERVDYLDRVTTLVADRQPAGANGWSDLIAAGERCQQVIHDVEATATEELVSRSYGRLDFSGLFGAGALDAEHHRFEIEALATMRERGVFDLMATAAAAPRFVRTIELDDEPLMAVRLPNLARFRNLARVRTASMRVAAERGDDAEMLRALEESLAIGRATGSQFFIIDRLVGQAIFALVLQELQYLLLEREFGAATAAEIVEIIDRQAHLAPVTLSIEGERSLVLDLVQISFTDNGHGNGQLKADELAKVSGWAMAGPSNSLMTAAIAPFQAGRRETIDILDRFYDALSDEAQMTPVNRATGASPSAAIVGSLGYRHMFIAPILPAINRAIHQDDESQFRIATMRIMVALAAHRARHGSYPESLDELVPDVLAALPADPVHGGALVYRRGAPGAPGLPYLLYSTGLDQLDDSAALGPADPAISRTLGDGVWGPTVDVMMIHLRPPREDRE